MAKQLFEVLATIERPDGAIEQRLINFNNPGSVYNFQIVCKQVLFTGGRVLTERVTVGCFPKTPAKDKVSEQMDQLTMGRSYDG